jgi:hypothetical protein
MTQRLRFTPCALAIGRPHVMLDSLPIDGTSIVLSHWPSVRNPISVTSDTSTGLVFDFTRSGGDLSQIGDCTAVHFDVDGLVALHAALHQPDAVAEPFWRAVASGGDFRVASDARVRRAVYALETTAAVASAKWASLTRRERTGLLYQFMLRSLISHSDALMADELVAATAACEEHHKRCVELLASSAVTIQSLEDVDLACVEISSTLNARQTAFLSPKQEPYFGLDEFAVHTCCKNLNVLISWSGRHVLVQRYEGWVQGADTAWAERRDLEPLRQHLQLNDPDTAWSYDGVYQPFSALRSSPAGCSALAPPKVAAIAAEYLRIAPIGWHPHCMGLASENATS